MSSSVLLDLALKLAHAQTELIFDELLVTLLSDEVSARKEYLPELSLLEIGTHLFIADAQAHSIGLVHHRALRDHAVGGALHQERHELLRDIAAKLLASQHAGAERHLLQSNVLVANAGQHTLLGNAAAEVVAEHASGNEGDDHHHADNKEDATQNNFLDWAFCLQKSNHACMRLQAGEVYLNIIKQGSGSSVRSHFSQLDSEEIAGVPFCRSECDSRVGDLSFWCLRPH